MSAEYRYRCPSCGFQIEFWDDGRQFILDDDGNRHYFYHPGEREVIDAVVAKSKWAQGLSQEQIWDEIDTHIGRQIETICLQCGATARRTEGSRPRPCRKCKSRDVPPFENLIGKHCPKCQQGIFPEKEWTGTIS